jgi:hypothetical protein
MNLFFAAMAWLQATTAMAGREARPLGLAFACVAWLPEKATPSLY